MTQDREHLKNVMTDAAIGAGFGLVVACYGRTDYRSRAAFGAVLGVLGGGLLRNHYQGAMAMRSSSRVLVGWTPPPHPIEVMPNFDPKSSRAEQARAVIMDYLHDDNLRNWFDKGEVTSAFGVKHKEDYDPSQLIAAYENKNSPIWKKLGGHPETSWKEFDKNVSLAIAKRKKLGKLPKASYDKSPIRIYYYDDDRMKAVEYARENLGPMMDPNNHYYWRDPHTKTYETQDPAAIERERQKPGNLEKNGWGGEGFSWDKDVPGQFGQILTSTLQVLGFVLTATGYLAVVGSALTQASPYIGTLAGMADDAFQGNDNSKAVAAISKMVLAVANKGLGEVAGVELPPVAMQALGTGVDALGQQIAAGQKEHLDYTGIWSNIVKKAGSFTKIGDKEAQAIEKILGETSAGSTFIKGYQTGKISDLSTIDAISKLFLNQANANVWMLGAGMGQLAVHQGAAQKTLPQKQRPAQQNQARGWW